MSPVHRSSSNVDTSNAALASGSAFHYSEGEEGLDADTNIQRSYSMPPAMFDGRTHHFDNVGCHADDDDGMGGASGGARRPSRDRERSGICIQRTQGSRRRNRQSQSEDELTTTVGKDGPVVMDEEEEEEKGEERGGMRGTTMADSYPRGRRNAFRGGVRVARSATCAADGSYVASAAAARRHMIASEQPENSK